MPRKHRQLNRDSGVFRDASLIVIASEDTYAVKQYFARFRTSRVQVEVIETDDCRSAPQHVIDRLNKFKQENVTEEGDSFWLCVDRDRWAKASLNDVLRDCLGKKYGIALSNPCFELWILLHYEEVPDRRTCSEIKERLREILGGYGKNCCSTIALTEQMVRNAIERARARATDTESLIPDAPVTHMFKVMDAILAKEGIRFADGSAS